MRNRSLQYIECSRTVCNRVIRADRAQSSELISARRIANVRFDERFLELVRISSIGKRNDGQDADASSSYYASRIDNPRYPSIIETYNCKIEMVRSGKSRHAVVVPNF